MDKCMREQHLDENMSTDLIYADDQAMVAHISEELENKLSNWNTIMVENGMRISKEKTEVILLSRAHQDINISLEEQSLKQCQNYEYLGVEFNDQNDSKLEITYRIHKFTNNLCLLYPLMKDRNIPVCKGVAAGISDRHLVEGRILMNGSFWGERKGVRNLRVVKNHMLEKKEVKEAYKMKMDKEWAKVKGKEYTVCGYKSMRRKSKRSD